MTVTDIETLLENGDVAIVDRMRPIDAEGDTQASVGMLGVLDRGINSSYHQYEVIVYVRVDKEDTLREAVEKVHTLMRADYNLISSVTADMKMQNKITHRMMVLGYDDTASLF